MDPEAIIHFVGLLVFTTQLNGTERTQIAVTRTTSAITANPTSRVVAILPAVKAPPSPYPMEKSTQRAARAKQPISGERVEAAEVVEPHAALIIYETWARQEESTWPGSQLSTDTASNLSNFEYVELNGDRVEFVADRPNGRASIPPQLAHIGGTLTASYTGPTYPSAAAVFDIPYGDLRACWSKAVGTSGRLDTELRLKNSGTFTIRSGNKTLVLDTNATVYVVNVPMDYARAHDLNHTARNHFLVYCRMAGISDAACKVPRPPSNSSCGECDQNEQRVDPSKGPSKGSDKTAAKPRPQPSNRIGELPIVALASFECSNTQYP